MEYYLTKQSQDDVTLFGTFPPAFIVLYLVLHFSEVRRCEILLQSQDNVALFPQPRATCLSLFCSTFLRGVEVRSSLTRSG